MVVTNQSAFLFILVKNKQSLLLKFHIIYREGVVIILNYVLLGILLYVVAIPIVEELSTVLVQGLEIIKGKLLVIATNIQNELNDTTTTDKTESSTSVIGFQVPSTQYYEEDYEEDDE